MMTNLELALLILLGFALVAVVATWAERVTLRSFDEHSETAIDVANDGDPR